MEIEEKLKDAAAWRPDSEMPMGLERQVLLSQNRPPLRPIGITRPRSVLFATVMAGAVCSLMVVRVGQKIPEAPVAPVAIETPIPSPPVQELVPPRKAQKLQIPEQSAKMPRQIVQMPRRKQHTSRHLRQIPRQAPIAVDAVSDSVVSQSRVAVEAPVYVPAYYAQPSVDGESVQYTPVSMALADPDVIYSESQQEN